MRLPSTAKVTSTSAKTSTAGASSASCTREWARLPARLFLLRNRREERRLCPHSFFNRRCLPQLWLNPAQLLHCQSGMPNLRHVPDLVAVKFHDIHIVGLHAPACLWTRAALARMRGIEDAVCADAFSRFVRAE